ncbi:MAG: hypothetical protein U1E76_18780 [Planctomycetota bacterium]
MLLANDLPAYQLLGERHRGGQGVVFEAMQRTTRRHVAIKVLKEGPFSGPDDRARFEREVQILGALQHPGIVTIRRRHGRGILLLRDGLHRRPAAR